VNLSLKAGSAVRQADYYNFTVPGSFAALIYMVSRMPCLFRSRIVGEKVATTEDAIYRHGDVLIHADIYNEGKAAFASVARTPGATQQLEMATSS